MTDNKTALGAHGTNGASASHEVIADIKQHYVNLKTQLLGQATTLSAKAKELDGKLTVRSKKLYGIEDYNTKKDYTKKILLVVAMIIVATAELPLNLKGFEVLGMNQNFTYLLAIIVGVILAGLAELSGFCIKRGESTGKVMMWVFGILAFAGGVVIIQQIAQLRHDYLVHMHKTAWDITSQVMLAGAMYLGGVIVGYLTTTGVKNKKAEDIFLQMTSELRTVQGELEKTRKRILNLANEQKLAIDGAHKAAATEASKQQKAAQDAENKRISAENKVKEKEAKKKKDDDENGIDADDEEETGTQTVKVDKDQTNFETALATFKHNLNDANVKVQRHDDATGADLRGIMEDDLNTLEAEMTSLELLATSWPAGADELNNVTESFNLLKTTVSEKA